MARSVAADLGQRAFMLTYYDTAFSVALGLPTNYGYGQLDCNFAF